MYYYLEYHSRKQLFNDENEALHLMDGWLARLQASGCRIIDYLLLKTRLQLVVQGTLPIRSDSRFFITPIFSSNELLDYLRYFSCLGFDYPLCGAWELYHKSRCYATIGKAGSPALPFTLRQIIKAKKSFDMRHSTVTGDQIADRLDSDLDGIVGIMNLRVGQSEYLPLLVSDH